MDEPRGTTALGMPGVGKPRTLPEGYRVDVGEGFSLRLFDVGLACCAVEFAAAVQADPDLFRLDASPAGPTEVLVVSGTVTNKTAPSVRRLYDLLPDPKRVISFGSCANSGGPYWDSYCVTKGVDEIVPVDVYVPGCPPRPESLLDGLRALADQEKR